MKRANALILVLVVLIIVGLGTTAILQAMISYANMRIVSIDRIKAQYLAEAGTQIGIWQCQQGDFTSPVTITTEEWPIVITKTLQPDGAYEVSARVQYPGL
jgi:Tfp pilus assembly protein PilX